MSIKISNFVPLNTPAGNDIIPIIDVSEPNTADQNKKITVDNLLSLAGGGGNPYLQTDLTGTFSSNIGTSGIILGENNDITSDEVENSLIVGNNNSLTIPGDFQEGNNNYIIGSFNTNKDYSKQTTILGYLNTIAGDTDYSVLIGSESFLGFRTDGYSEVSFDSKCSFIAGYKNTSLGFSNTCVGNNNTLYEGAQTSVVIGSNIYVNNDVGIGNNADIIANTISIGEDVMTRKSNSISIGTNIDNLAEGASALGQYSYIESLAEDSITISGYIEDAAIEGIAIGKFSYIRGPGAIAIGSAASCNSTTSSPIAIGDGAAARGTNSIVIGKNNGVNLNAADTISIGAQSVIFNGSSQAILLGTNNNINNNSPNSISIGYGNTIFINSPNCIALGYNANIATNLTNAIQLGTGTVSTSNTLQFGSTKLANSNLGLIVKTNTTAPTVTASDVGTLGLNAGTPQYVDSGGTWTNLGSSVIKYGAYLLVKTATTQSVATNSTVVLLHDSASAQTPASGYTAIPISYNTSTGTITFTQTGAYRIFGSFTLTSTAATQGIAILPNSITGSIGFNGSNLFTTGAANSFNHINVDIVVTVDSINSTMKIAAITPNTNTAPVVVQINTSTGNFTTNKISITTIS